MTPDDFREFGKQHAQRFPGAADYLRLEVNRADWQRALADVPFSDAADASYALTTGELTARGWSAQLAAILSFCRQRASERAAAENKPRYVDGEETYACLRCHDGGLLSVWSARSIAAVRKGASMGEKGTCDLQNAACDCAAGRRREGYPPYNAERHMACDRLDLYKAVANEDDAQQFIAWARAERMPANYSPGLANYAESMEESF